MIRINAAAIRVLAPTLCCEQRYSRLVGTKRSGIAMTLCPSNAFLSS
jgi:hypothetical protein